jgi:hypothetical protein
MQTVIGRLMVRVHPGEQRGFVQVNALPEYPGGGDLAGEPGFQPASDLQRQLVAGFVAPRFPRPIGGCLDPHDTGHLRLRDAAGDGAPNFSQPIPEIPFRPCVDHHCHYQMIPPYLLIQTCDFVGATRRHTTLFPDTSVSADIVNAAVSVITMETGGRQ